MTDFQPYDYLSSPHKSDLLIPMVPAVESFSPDGLRIRRWVAPKKRTCYRFRPRPSRESSAELSDVNIVRLIIGTNFKELLYSLRGRKASNP